MIKQRGTSSYSLLDSGDQKKLEQFGDYLLVRPAAQAVWQPCLPKKAWQEVDAYFTREGCEGWKSQDPLPPSWSLHFEGFNFTLMPTDFGHIGLFPEHASQWQFMQKKIIQQTHTVRILNLFAYTGGATLAAAAAGAEVCHLDASKASVAWARKNAASNRMEHLPIRWVIDDAIKFLQREEKRGICYDGIVLDPPTFGRGTKGEVFKIERDLPALLTLCCRLLSKEPLFVICTSHTLGFTPIVMHHLLRQAIGNRPGRLEIGEMVLSAENALSLPSGVFARWSHGY